LDVEERRSEIVIRNYQDLILLTIPARFGLIWFSGFRGEDLNVKS
jgi:hypothetical protein